ncbi:MAG: DUF4177 domain-containing protein [Chloroflexaceae bacterium]|jgi:hypothetical protein|nr:DUF4177 domain-containing protein [Chloroflexaceae bacterium]
MTSEGQPTTRLGPNGVRWEYRVMSMNVDGFFGPHLDVNELGQYLNQAGNEGWELVTVLPVQRGEGRTSDLVGILKRPA